MLFREVNAHIADLEERIRLKEELLPLICECANTGCTTIIEVEHDTFEAVRKHPLRFLVAPGHERADVETVVWRGAGYLIVERLDPSRLRKLAWASVLNEEKARGSGTPAEGFEGFTVALPRSIVGVAWAGETLLGGVQDP